MTFVGVAGRKYFQISHERGSACVRRRAGCSREGSQRDVANGDRAGRAPHFLKMEIFDIRGRLSLSCISVNTAMRSPEIPA